jgi:hypothetical protein
LQIHLPSGNPALKRQCPCSAEWTLLLQSSDRIVSNRVARFFLALNTKTGKIYQNTTNYTKCPQNITKDCKMDQVSLKYNNIFHCKTLQNLPKFGFSV